MMKSIIDPTLSYKESTQLDKNDIGLENVQAYEVKLLDIPLYVILGSINKTFEKNKVFFAPLYVLNPTNYKVAKQIGLFELSSDDIPNHVNESDPNQITLDTLKDKLPIIFSFVSVEFLKPFSSNKKPLLKIKKKLDEKEEIIDLDEEESDDDETKETGETGETDETFKLKEKIIDGTLPWVAYYFKDINFTVIDNPGGGDCFFFSLKQAYDTKGKEYSIARLRNIVAENFKQDFFDAYQEKLQLFDDTITSERKKLDAIDLQIGELTDALMNSTQVETKRDIQNKLQIAKVEKNAIKKEIQEDIQDKQNAMNDVTMPFKMISNTPTLAKLQEEIKKSGGDYWADINGINILEKELNVKFIIFEKMDRDNTDFLSSPDKHVSIQCNKNDELTSTFDPDDYILIEFLGFGHYRLIKHNSSGMFTFDELPDIVKDKVVNRCIESLEKNNSAFHNILQFRDYFEKQLEKNPPKPYNIPEDSSDSPVDSQDSINSCINGLCDDSVVLTFHNNADIKHNPGSGPDDKMPKMKQKEYKLLQKYQKKPYLKNWRSILSDDYVDPTNTMVINVNGVSYPSITEFVKSKKIDKGSYQDALLSKFRDNNESNGLYFKEILLATNDSKLLQHVERNQPLFAKDLMLLRNKLKGAIHS